ncbi:hypothetical protein NC651_031053 [Populus alba x Populus x berolinensis]|nr:hypothetical protein NC651_031053 [Populus alba x Populus x berolinensis]
MQSSGSDSQTQQEQNQRQQPPPPPQQQHTRRRLCNAASNHTASHYGPPPPQHYLAAAYHQYQPHHHHLPHVQQHTQKQQREGSGRIKLYGLVISITGWMKIIYIPALFPLARLFAISRQVCPRAYGFVEFLTHATAEKVLQNYGGILMPNTEQPFRLNWATFSTGDKRSDNAPDLSIFVGDLAADETFVSKYPSVKAAKVVFDANTGRSKGYGFVRFGDDSERTRAMTEMNGLCVLVLLLPGSPLDISNKVDMHQMVPLPKASNQMVIPTIQHFNLLETNVFLLNRPCFFVDILLEGLTSVTDEDLKQPFSQYGEIVSVKMPVGKGCGFVHIANRDSAEEAMQKLNGTVIGKQTVRLSWVRNPANKQIWVAHGMGHTMEDSFMMVMDMLCHRLMIQACMLRQLRHMGLTLYMAATSSNWQWRPRFPIQHFADRAPPVSPLLSRSFTFFFILLCACNFTDDFSPPSLRTSASAIFYFEFSAQILNSAIGLYHYNYPWKSRLLSFWRHGTGTPKVKVGVVGAGTASIFQEVMQSSERSLDDAFTPSKGFGIKIPNNGNKRCTVMYPASSKASNEIEQGLYNRGFEVVRLNTYTTVPVGHVDEMVLKQAISAPVVAVASPSSVRAWANLIPESEEWNNSVACIGETTGSAAKRLGFKKVYFPRQPGLEGLTRLMQPCQSVCMQKLVARCKMQDKDAVFQAAEQKPGCNGIRRDQQCWWNSPMRLVNRQFRSGCWREESYGDDIARKTLNLCLHFSL